MSSAPKPAPPVDMLLSVSLYAAEFFLLVMALAIHRLGDRSLASSLGSTPGIGFVVGCRAGTIYRSRADGHWKFFNFPDKRLPVEIPRERLTGAALERQVQAAIRLRDLVAARGGCFGQRPPCRRRTFSTAFLAEFDTATARCRNLTTKGVP